MPMSSNVLETSSASVQEDGAEIVRVNQYILKGKLGEGAYGVVLECVDDRQQRWAIKYVSKSLLKRQKEYTRVGRKMTITTAFDDVKREIALMKKLNHPHIVSLHEVVDDPDNDKLFMIMELVNGGQVMEWNKETHGFTSNPRLRKIGGTGHEMTEEYAKHVIRDVIIGLNYLHTSHVVHRDLKPQNLLLTDDLSRIYVKIADFGVSHMFESLEASGNGEAEGERLTRVKGTYPFYAPECLESESFDGYRADIWALGINLYAFLTGKLPYYDESPPKLFDMIQTNPVDFDLMVGLGCSTEAINFTKQLLEKDCEKRPKNAREVMEISDPWLGEVLQDPPNLEKAISITDAEISAALTTATLSIATVASLKIFVQKWRKRASIAAMKRREDEMRASIDNSSHSPAGAVRKSASGLSIADNDSPKTVSGKSPVANLAKDFGSDGVPAAQNSIRAIKAGPGEDVKGNSLRAVPDNVITRSELASSNGSVDSKGTDAVASASKKAKAGVASQSVTSGVLVAAAEQPTSQDRARRRPKLCAIN